jgi:hypothetical protein
MSGPENTFIGSVHKHLPVGLYHMKNHNQYNGGIADVWYSGAESDLWIEYKFIKVPARGDTVINLTAGKKPEISFLQQDWLRSRSGEGRNIGVLVGSKDGGVWFPATLWELTFDAATFRKALRTRKELAALITSFVGAP